MGKFFIKNRCFVIHCIMVFCSFFSETRKTLEQSNEVTIQANPMILKDFNCSTFFTLLEQYPDFWNNTPFLLDFRITIDYNVTHYNVIHLEHFCSTM